MNSKYSSLFSFILCCSFILMFSSCNEDLLDTKPNTSIDEKDAFSTPSRILSQVNNLYGRLQNESLYGGRLIVFNEQRSDEFGQNDGNAATGSAVWNQNVASTNEYINNVWSAAYTAINSSNIVIANLTNTKVISDSLAKHYIAEAKFVRALSYLVLLQTYAKPYNMDKAALGVPLRLTAITSEGYNDLARSSVEEVYTQIIKDLDEAEQALPVSYSSAALNSSRAHRATAIALKTRVYLNLANYNMVIQEAKKIVSTSAPYQYSEGNVNHKLEANFTNLYTGSYTGAESIFSIPFANSSTETPFSQSALAFNYVTQPILFLAKGGIVANPVLQNPADSRATMIGINAAKQSILKKFNITTAPFRDYVPVIRYAEVLLNYAEAAAETGELNTAVALLHAVRQRSHAGYQFADAEINTKQAFIQTIVTERRIEFLGEGLRLQDLQRRVEKLPAKTGSIGTAPEVFPDAKNYIWPIPSGELSTNKLCLPN